MQKNKLIIAVVVLAAMVLPTSSPTLAWGGYEATTNSSGVSSITLSGEGSSISWTADGYSANGFKVVWSKNEGPVYPNRAGDKYHYYSDSNKSSDTVAPFSGAGTYFVRVCEYLGGDCGVYSNQISVNLAGAEVTAVDCTMDYNPVCGQNGKTYSNKCVLTAAGISKSYYGECKKDDEIKSIETNAKKLQNNQLGEILSELKELRNLVKEQQNQIMHLQQLLAGVAAVTEKMQNSITSFITYGVDENTKKLGEGERAAVMYSFKSAFGKLPKDESELADAIKIANGRWPSMTSEEAENKAREKFEKIYKRMPDMDDPSDNAAVTIMAYGLRQKAKNRNLNTEKNGLKIYKHIFHKLPASTEEWNALQAISYSGATR